MAEANPDSRPPTPDPSELAPRFAAFGAQECRGYSPLYERLAAGSAGDPAVLALAAEARAGPVPNLFFAAVHDLLLAGVTHPLAAFYPSIRAGPPPPGDPYPLFHAFCAEQAAALRARLQTRRVQTNEVARCACFRPAFSRVAALEPGRPLALVEVGASAGLNLLADRYRYDYGTGPVFGPADSPVLIRCALRGPGRPPIAETFPPIAARTGLDLHPVDLRDPEAVRWLRALIWPEHQERLRLLDAAVTVAQAHPPRLVAGDALETLPAILPTLPADAVLCVFHSFTLNQFPPAARAHFRDLLAAASADRVVYRLGLESSAGQQATLDLSTFRAGTETHAVLATCHPHGWWMAWEVDDGN